VNFAAEQNDRDPQRFEDNPFAAPGVQDVLRPAHQVIGRWLTVTLVLQYLILVGGVIASYVEVESIMFSGPAYSIAGILVAVTALYYGNRSALWIAVSAPSFALFIFLLIFLSHWTPADASGPVPILCTVYLLAVLVATFLMFNRMRRDLPSADAEVSSQLTQWS
jgi:hypothetical protein